MKVGDSLNGYVLLEQIAEGGMGAVWKAKHPNLDRLVAIKCIRPELLKEPSARTLFFDEIKHLSQLHSPQVVQVLDSGVSENDEPFMVTEYLNGCDLSDYLDERGPPSVLEVCRIGIEVLRALTEAHALGIIHGDLKPSNIYLMNLPGEKLPIIKVLDFGVASLVEEGQDAESTLGGREVRGSLQYMAPEQLTQGPIGPASDVYTVGATLYRLLTNRHPYSGDSQEQIRAKLTEMPPAPSSMTTLHPIPERLDTLILSCLARRPEDRPSSASALRKRLEYVQSQIEPTDGPTRTTTAVDQSVPDWLQSGFSHRSDNQPDRKDRGDVDLGLAQTAERNILELDLDTMSAETSARQPELKTTPEQVLLPRAEAEVQQRKLNLTLDDSRTVEQAAPTISRSLFEFNERNGGRSPRDADEGSESLSNQKESARWSKYKVIALIGVFTTLLVSGFWFVMVDKKQSKAPKKVALKASAGERLNQAKALLNRLRTDRPDAAQKHASSGMKSTKKSPVEQIVIALPKGYAGRFLNAETKAALCAQEVMSCRVPRNLDVLVSAPRHYSRILSAKTLQAHRTELMTIQLKPRPAPKKK